jgi:hypothetical protein
MHLVAPDDLLAHWPAFLLLVPGLPITLELNISLCEIFNVILFFGGDLGA